ncbi:MAG TPA: hypothetical protein VGO06_13635 [Bosea sp. (in: a-proteobacteria)]|jgi:hypothetical protein|uniref:hypothetical protein n=1 Tax=Bosea sp. (in: a-proteobacteria) TaxID=1871050 RepID=UPI002E156E63|nr:hypothetical protein [Bosea sp. (in: a-proteobacteria)]
MAHATESDRDDDFFDGLMPRIRVAFLRSIRGLALCVATIILAGSFPQLTDSKYGLAIFIGILVSINLTKWLAVGALTALTIGALLPPSILSLFLQAVGR